QGLSIHQHIQPDSEGHFLQGSADEGSIRHRVQEIAAEADEQLDIAALRSFQHRAGCQAGLRRDWCAPVSSESGRAGVVDCLAAGENIWGHSALAGGLNGALTTNRRDASARATELAECQREVYDRLDVVRAGCVLSQTHSPCEGDVFMF